MKLLTMDGGCGKSAFSLLQISPRKKLPSLLDHQYLENEKALEYLGSVKADVFCMEAIVSNGGAGSEVVQTAYWNGRFWQQAENNGLQVCSIERRNVKRLLFGKAVGNDSAVLNYVQDLYGGRSKAKGTKKAPGPLYGVSSHVWQSLGVAFAYLNIPKGSEEDFLWDSLYTERDRFRERKEERKQTRIRQSINKSKKGQTAGRLNNKLKDIL